ncbi:interaptin-like [Mercenaria mercenaria]|uniref:interaptin-like n=1 Tax=Mercenaria mercenaria TaxID=6596 RepID=UPI00234EE753|nr:interaptin-like [Mercenaria mercenaria]
MAYSMLVGPLKRANDSLSRSLGLFDTSRGFHYRERNYSNPGQREFQRLQIECHQLKQHMVRQSQIYADRVNCLEEVSNEVIRLQQYQIYRLSKKIERRDLEIDELLEMLQNEEWKQLNICDKNVLAVNNVMVETDEQICDLRNQLQTALNDNHEKEVKMKDSTALLKTKIAQLETEVGLKDLKTKNLEKLLESTKTEIDSKNEELAKQDKQLAEQKHQLQQMFSKLHATEDTTMGVTITSLETKKKYIEEEIEKDQDKLLANEKTEIIQMNRRLQGTFASNGSDADGTIALLKKKIEHLEEEAGDHELQIKKLEELLASERLAISDKYEVVRQEMKEKDDHLQEMRVELQQTFKLMHEKESELDGIITSLRKDVTNLEKEVTQRDLKVKDLEVKRSKDMHKSDKNEQLTNKLLKEKDDLLSAQRNQLLHITKTFEGKEAEMNETITSLKKKIQNLEAESANGREVELKGMTKTLGHKNIESVNRKQQEKEMLVLKVKLQNTLTKLKDTETELDETRTRLSKAMGDRLTDNNPNIADLSDRNRPTKLAERYAELYDNQWTDAFDILVTYFHREGNAVEALLKILQDVMRFCQMKGQKQMESLEHVLEFSDKHDRRDLSADMRNILKVGRKAMASVAVGNLFQMYVSHLKGSTDKASRIALNVSSFTQECLEICWLMTIQDPSVVFAPLLRRGTRFNTDLFKPYTSSGTHVDYVVWPALLLHEGGPVLAKGVAQGYNKKENKSHNNK